MFFHFPYFYSLFVIGLFLFFDSLEHHLRRSTSFHLIFPFINTKTIFIAIIVTWITDWLLGQTVFRIWYYPFYKNMFNQVLLYLIVYPVGGLSLVAMYRVFTIIYIKEFRNQRLFRLENPDKILSIIIHMTFLLLPTSFFLPVVFYLTDSVNNLQEHRLIYNLLALLILYEWGFFFDTVTLVYKGKPLLFDIIRGRKSTIFAWLTTAVLAAFLHEYINTYAYEWRYIAERMPISTVKIFNIPVTILLGWIFMTALCISAYRAAITIGRHHKKHAFEAEYFPTHPLLPTLIEQTR